MTEEEVFDAALQLPAEKRSEFLHRVCSEEMRASVEKLLELAQQPTDFMMDCPWPAAQQASQRGGPSESSIGAYRLGEILGEGGMGVVYRAYQDEPVVRQVAIKIIKPGLDTQELLSRFRSEQRVLAALDHPFIARVFGAGSTETGRPYFAMELVEGLPITEYCDQYRLTTQDRLKLFIDVCKAVQHAHSKSIVHRDLKPSNVLVVNQDGNCVPKVIDFGIAKALDRDDLNRTMATGNALMLGTPLYMSPEQAATQTVDIDTRTDIYSLGVLLYELLTGSTPFARQRLSSASDEERRRIIREEDPPKPSTCVQTLGDSASAASTLRGTDPRRLSRQLQGDLDWIVMKAIEKDRNRRYTTVNDFAEDLQRHLDCQPVLASPPSHWYRAKRLLQRNRWAATVAAGMLTLLLLGTLGTTLGLISAIRANRALDGSLQNEAKLRLAAEESEARAVRESHEARRQAEIAREIVNFLREDLLAAAAPSMEPGRGRDVGIQEVLDEAAKRMENVSAPGGRFADKPEVEAALRLTIGKTYTELGFVDQATPQLERAAQIQQAELAEDQELALSISEELAEVYSLQGKIDVACQLGRRVLQGYSEMFGPRDRKTLTAMNNLAAMYSRQGEFAQAAELFADLADLRVELLGEDHLDTIITQSNLANSQLRLNQIEDARALLSSLLPRARQSKDPETLATVLQNLGEAKARNGQLKDAKSMFQESLEIRRELFGGDHSSTMELVSYLGVLASMQEDWQAARAHFETVLDTNRRLLGTQSTQTVSSTVNLVSALLRLDNIAEAVELMDRCRAEAEAELGHDNVFIRRIYKMYGHAADSLREASSAPLEEARVRKLLMEHHLMLAQREETNAEDLHLASLALADPAYGELQDLTKAVEFARLAVDRAMDAETEIRDTYQSTLDRLQKELSSASNQYQ